MGHESETTIFQSWNCAFKTFICLKLSNKVFRLVINYIKNVL